MSLSQMRAAVGSPVAKRLLQPIAATGVSRSPLRRITTSREGLSEKNTYCTPL